MPKALSKRIIICSGRQAVQNFLQQQLKGLPLQIFTPARLLDQQSPWSETLVLYHLQDPERQKEQVQWLIKKGADVLLLTDQPSTQEGIRWLRQGIKGYLETQPQAEQLARTLEAIAQGRVWLGQDLISALIQQLNAGQSDAAAEQTRSLHSRLAEYALTPREEAVAQALLTGKSNKEIAEQLHISERTVKAHVHALLRKTQTKDRLAFVLKLNPASN